MLFASLQIQDKTGFTVAILSRADQPSRHFSDELFAARKDSQQWAAVLQRRSQRLPLCDCDARCDTHATMSSELLRVRGLKKRFPIRRGLFPRVVGHVQAVDSIDLDIAQGEALGLVGESGCGKTTAGRCLLRLIEPTEGEIHFDGQPIHGLSRAALRPYRREMQIVFQDPFSSLNPRHTILETLSEPLRLHGLAKTDADCRTQSRALMDRVRERLDGRNWLTEIGTAVGKGAIFTFTVEGAHAHDIAQVMDRYGVAVRAGLHCAEPLSRRFGITSSARASFALYNTLEDADAFADALIKAREFFA
jgi:ABC-type glutathione transport system ATPase component